MALTLCAILVVIVIERYANRTDTKAVVEKRVKNKEYLSQKQKEGTSFFSSEDIFKRTTTERSMTV